MVRHPLRSNDIRERNEKLVLNLIFARGPMSQSKIVQETGLKAPTVFRIFNKLEEEGRISPCDTEESVRPTGDRKGRKPSFYCIEPDSGYAIGVDFSRIATAVIVVNLANEVIYSAAREHSESPSRDTVLHTVSEMLDTALSKSGIDRERLLGIGIAAPGRVDTAEGRVVEYPRIEGLSGFSIREHFKALYDTEVYVHNNTSVIAAAAYHYGDAREENSLLAVLVRSGVGGALVNHGEIFLNGTTTVLEIGRMFPTDGPGDNLESIVSETAMLAKVREATGIGRWEEVERGVTREQLAPVLVDASTVLSRAVRNLYHVFHPDAVLLISRFRILTDVLSAAIITSLPECRVIPQVYDPVQACYGATDMVFSHFFRRNSMVPAQLEREQG